MISIFKSKLKYSLAWITALVIISIPIAIVVTLADTSQDGPDTNVKVTVFRPNEMIIDPTNITVVFSKDLVPDSLLDVFTDDIPLRIDPPIPGMAKWIDNNMLRFYPETRFRLATEYSVRIQSDKTYLYGNKINDNRIFRFRSAPLLVRNVKTEVIASPESPSDRRIIVHITLNNPVAISELLARLTISLNGNTEILNFSSTQSEADSIITLASEPFNPAEINGKFVLKIEKGLSSPGGNIPLKENYYDEFMVSKPARFIVNGVHSRGAGVDCVVEISLSQPVEINELKSHISITPAVDFTIDQQYYYTILRGNFKPRETFTIDIKKGLRALSGARLEEDFSTKISTGDLRPSLKFVDEGVYMSKSGRQLMAIESVNIDEVTVEVEQVFSNNIAYYMSSDHGGYYGNDISRVGRKIFFKNYPMNNVLNEPTNSTIDLGSIVGDSLLGIYNVSKHKKDERWRQVSRQVMITDLGILARRSDSYLMVWVNSLSKTLPIKSAEVNLITRNNQTIASGLTDSDGIAVFENIDTDALKSDPFLITVSKGNDLSYLRFSDCLITTSEFDVAGRPYLTHGYESFIFSDRGVYRPGEKIHIVSTVRGKDGAVPPEFPYILEIEDPRGRDFTDFKLTTADDGISAVDFDIPNFAETGKYGISAKIGDELIGKYDFQVEEFMPDRIKTELSTDKDTYATGDNLQISVNGKYLFGPPCSGNAVSGHVTIESEIFSVKKWGSFSFVNQDIKFTPIESQLQDSQLNDAGNIMYDFAVPAGLYSSSALKMILSATVREDGGRAVSDYKVVKLNPYPIYIGIRKEFERFVKPGEAASFSVVAVDHDGNAAGADSVWVKLYRTIYHTIVKKDNRGYYRYVSEGQDHIVDSVRTSVNQDARQVQFTVGEYGEYKVVAGSGNTGHTAATSFYASGWGYSPWSMANPDRIEMKLDKSVYQFGDTAKLLVEAPFNGKLLLTVEKDIVLEYRSFDLDSNTAEIAVPISKSFAPNVYLTATLIKSTTSLERHSPSRAFGIAPLTVDNSKRNVKISITAPDIVKPRQKIDISVKSNAKNAGYIVALVDFGIIQLTDFETPDPFDFFYGKKRPSLQPYDIYSMIYPDIEAVGEILSPAGGKLAAERKRHLNPISAKRVKPVALWSGLLKTDINGNGATSFELPQFNGKLKIMVVMVDGARFGSKSGEITVRDKIIIQESLPRFLAPGDKLDARIVAFNNTGNSSDIDFNLTVSEPMGKIHSQRNKQFINNGNRGISLFAYTSPLVPGKLKFSISAECGNDSSLEIVEMANRPAQPLLTEHGAGTVRDGSPVEINFPTNWIEGTEEYRLRVSSMPAVKFAGGIQYLLRYPYGCVEQTTSKILPLLYFNDLAKIVEPEIFGGKGHEYFIREGILKISSMQKPDGSFQYWPSGTYVVPWAGVYASHALIEARKAGYLVPDDVYDKTISFLQNCVRDVRLSGNKSVLRIYAAYILSLAGKLDKSVLNNLKRLDVYSLPLYSRFQLAGAIALTSGIDQALWLIPAEIHPLKYEPETGGYFDSDIRANAIMIETLCDIAPDHPSLPELVKETSERLTLGGWYTTQSNAFALLAMGKYFRNLETPDYTGTVVVGGKRYAAFGTADTSFVLPKGNEKVEISINGTGLCYYYWQASGVSADRSIKEFDNRLVVRKQYLDDNGNPLLFDAVELGDQVVVKITAQSMDKSMDNVVISDLLPACLEIENARLSTSAKLSWIPESFSGVEYSDIRDDRLLLYINMQQGKNFEYYYSTRVTSSGQFTIPPVTAECMYDPTIASSASSGTMRVLNR